LQYANRVGAIMSRRLILMVMFATLSALIFTVDAQCSWEGFDLTPLSFADMYGKDSAQGFVYYLRFCAPITTQACQNPGSSFCQFQGGQPKESLGAWATASWSKVSAGAGGVTVTLNGDSSSGCPQGRTSIVTVNCDPNAPAVPLPNPKPFQFIVTTQGGCTYSTSIVAPAGCEVPSKAKSGLSGGSVFLIILIVVIPVYVAAGCVYKRKRQGLTGMEACPNVDFWRDLPGLVKSGFSFTYGKLRSLCGSAPSDSYETVK